MLELHISVENIRGMHAGKLLFIEFGGEEGMQVPGKIKLLCVFCGSILVR